MLFYVLSVIVPKANNQIIITHKTHGHTEDQILQALYDYRAHVAVLNSSLSLILIVSGLQSRSLKSNPLISFVLFCPFTWNPINTHQFFLNPYNSFVRPPKTVEWLKTSSPNNEERCGHFWRKRIHYSINELGWSWTRTWQPFLVGIQNLVGPRE